MTAVSPTPPLRFRSLWSRLLTIAIPLVAVCSVAIFAVVEMVGYRSLRRELLEKVDQTVEVNSRMLATSFWYVDNRNIEAAVEAMMRDSDIVAVVARNADGTVLARGGWPESELGTALRRRKTVRIEKAGLRQDLGELEIYFTEGRIRQFTWRRIGLDSILFVALLVILSTCVIFASHRTLALPISKLMASIREGKNHDVRKPVDWHSADELGDLIREYNEMLVRRSEAESELRRMALHDSLTQLPNRTLFLDRLRHSVNMAARRKQSGALLLIDIDSFREINENHGQEVGDFLLREVGERLAAVARDAGTAARLGGDQFAVIQETLDSVDTAAMFAQRVLESLFRPFRIGDIDLRVTVSIGVTIFPDDDVRPDALMKNADLALDTAKAGGRHGYRYFVPEMDQAVRERKQMEEDLLVALHEHQLVLHYQPKIALRSRKIVGAEALVRWEHPRRGLISPGEFIPFAEACGLIAPLTDWVLEEACRQNKNWQREGMPAFRIGVNLSARHFREDSIVDSVAAVLDKVQLDPKCLELELTETAIMENPEVASETLSVLRSRGVAVAIDDFGTGYSSLGYLRRYPVDAIKIDRAFISDLGRSEDAATIVRAILGLGRSLQIRVVAEGVEDWIQMRFLEDEQCEEVQGFLVSRPLSAEHFGEWMKSQVAAGGDEWQL